MATDTSRLLKLPAEIRNRIYELVFADSTVIIQKAQKNVYRPESIGILTACRQTYKESIGYFYSLTTFYGQWRTLATFVIRLSRRYAEFITSLRIHHIDHSDGAAGLTYSHADCAFETQRTIFLMDDYFGKRCRNVPEGIIESKALVFQHDQQWYGTLWTCSPWQAYMERLSEIPDHWFPPHEDEEVRKISHFFQYEHDNCLKCWRRDWATSEMYTCGCPEKAKQEKECAF